MSYTLDWCQRGGARVGLMRELIARGWTIHGYKEDKSDLMTDYFDPSDWAGYAHLGGGEYPGVGDLVCWCAGSWIMYSIESSPIGKAVSIADKQVPKRSSWAIGMVCEGSNPIEANGFAVRVLKHGTGLYTRRDDDERIWDSGTRGYGAPAKRVAEQIDAFLARRESKQNPSTEKAARVGSGWELRESSIGRAGVVEIHFAEKPSEEVRSELKRAGFRWAKRNACWYGQQSRLPEAYGGMTEAGDCAEGK